MAYATVVSLTQILQQLLSPDDDDPIPPYSTVIALQRPLIKTLHRKLYSLRISLRDLNLLRVPKSRWSTIDELETRIRDTIYKAQDAIEYLLLIQSTTVPDASSSLLLLQETTADVDSITKTADEIRFSIEEEAERRGLSSSENAPAVPPDTKISDDDETIVVGHDEYLETLKDMLLDTPRLKVVWIVGMPGIGKTTLAKRVYNDPLIQGHFGTRAWVTISPDYRVVDVLSSLVACASKTIMDGSYGDRELKLRLHQMLFTEKYLVVIDNIWDYAVWCELQQAFPDETNGSRVILTTTNAHIGITAGCSSPNILRDPFLNDDASWELLRRVVFGEELSCPPELERIGRKIANNCEGLPLAIIEVGKLLRGTQHTVANWIAVEEDENPLVIGANEDTPLSKALTPSYKSLPMRLKALFLYMGLLPRNIEMRTSRLIRLWVSEGFIDQEDPHRILRDRNRAIKREEYADKFLDELVSRSLVLVRKHGFRGRTKTCGMHFVFRGLCISEAKKEGFFHIIKKLDDDGVPRGLTNTQQQQRICSHNNIVLGFKQVHESLHPISSARSLLCYGPHHPYPIQLHLRPFRLLRVLDSIALRFYMFPNQVLELVRLRYLAITYDGDLPPSISMLFNLEVLVVRRLHHFVKSSPNYLPIEIWNLYKLKHLHCMGSDLLDPSRHSTPVFLENLLTLSGVSAHSCVLGVLRRMPKLTKIGIRVVQLTTHIETFSFFGNFSHTDFGHDFESFKCVVVNPSLGVVSPNIFPRFYLYIRKMTLSGCGFLWEDMSKISRLPYLEVLKLRRYAFRGPVWEIVHYYEFVRLRSLLLEDLDVESLYGCFPVLQCLTIRHCYKLLEIDPHLIKVLLTLDMIEVDDCSLTTEIWARQLGDEAKVDNGYRLKVHIHSSRDAKNRA